MSEKPSAAALSESRMAGHVPVFGVLRLLIIISDIGIIIGSFAHKSHRLHGTPGAEGYTIATDGLRTWALLTMACGLSVAGCIVAANRWAKRKTLLLASCAVPFWLAAAVALIQFRDLMNERNALPDYELRIAIGIPMIVLGGVVGGIASVAIAARWSARRAFHR